MDLPVIPQKGKKQLTLTRDCEALQIPSGEKYKLSQGEHVVLMQTHGGFTIRTECGYLVRIAGSDADAIGLSAPSVSEIPTESGPFHIDQVMAALQTVFDPEIPVNIVELGLVYLCEEHPLETGGHKVTIEMSMTAPGCGMGDVLKEDAKKAIMAISGVTEADVTIVWEPPWNQSRMSEAARLQLGML
ncbi:MAG: putative Fe-S cluster assembly protein SufT [Nitrospirota bacterium]